MFRGANPPRLRLARFARGAGLGYKFRVDVVYRSPPSSGTPTHTQPSSIFVW